MEENEPNDCEESEKSCPDQQGTPQDLDDTTEVNGLPADGATKVTIDYSSDSSESNEKCPICLLSFYDQEIGTPDMCSHAFCASCIEAWAKMMKTCPIDRKSFATINIYQSYENRAYLRSVTVTTSVLNSFQNDLPLLLNAVAPAVLPPLPVILVDVDRPGDKCEICHRADREDVMLLCDECDCGYHIDCLEPVLQEIPHGSWYCANCPQEQETDVVVNEFGLMTQGMVEDGENYVEPVRKKSRQVAQITRTKQSELIRKTIMAILSRTKPGGRERRRKKRGRRSRPEPRNAHPEFDPSLRLPIRSSQRCASHNDQLQQRSHFRERIPMLNLFGSTHELEEVYNNDEENDDFSSSFGPVHMGGRPLYVSQPEGEVSSQVVCRQIVGFRNMQNILKIKNIIRTPRERPTLRVTPTTAPPNLLDSIMESQQIWHSKDGIKDVIVAKGKQVLKFVFEFENLILFLFRW
jgi:PHD-finger/Ring finger domain